MSVTAHEVKLERALRHMPRTLAATRQDSLPGRYSLAVQLLSMAAFTVAFFGWRQDRACIDCHGGARAPAVRSYATSKHGVIVTLEGADRDWTQPLRAANYRAPNCAYCHLHAGEHDTRRLLASDNDPVAAERARDAARAVCYDCHAPRYVARQGETGTRMLGIARMKWREGEALMQGARGRYPEAVLTEALRLLAQMQAHVTNVRLGVAHQSPDYQWWHGQPALDGDLLRIKGELSRVGRIR